MLLFYWYAVEDLSLCCQVTICAQRGPRIRTSNLSLIMPFPVEIIFLISYLSFSCNLFFLEKGEDKGGRVGFLPFFPYYMQTAQRKSQKVKIAFLFTTELSSSAHVLNMENLKSWKVFTIFQNPQPTEKLCWAIWTWGASCKTGVLFSWKLRVMSNISYWYYFITYQQLLNRKMRLG